MSVSTLPVAFRVDKESGKVIAVFFTEQSHDGEDGLCHSYGYFRPSLRGTVKLVGIHYVNKSTRPAVPSEYKNLLREMREIYETYDDDSHVNLSVQRIKWV
jgi:hypothetical protein